MNTTSEQYRYLDHVSDAAVKQSEVNRDALVAAKERAKAQRAEEEEATMRFLAAIGRK